jgi:hypothetical protein
MTWCKVTSLTITVLSRWAWRAGGFVSVGSHSFRVGSFQIYVHIAQCMRNLAHDFKGHKRVLSVSPRMRNADAQ